MHVYTPLYPNLTLHAADRYVERGEYAAAEDVLAELVQGGMLPALPGAGDTQDRERAEGTLGQASTCALVMSKYGWLLYTKRGKQAQGKEWLARAAASPGARWVRVARRQVV